MPRRNIVLIGFMGSGKSSIGRLVATRLGFQFLDTDALVAERAGMEITDIFERQGEARFRELETAALRSLSLYERCVIATGGGVILREENRTLLRELGLVVELSASEEVIFERVARNTRRPLLQTADPRETVAKLLAGRRPLYAEAAECSIDTSTFSHAQAADAVIIEARRAFSWQAAR